MDQATTTTCTTAIITELLLHYCNVNTFLYPRILGKNLRMRKPILKLILCAACSNLIRIRYGGEVGEVSPTTRAR